MAEEILTDSGQAIFGGGTNHKDTFFEAKRAPRRTRNSFGFVVIGDQVSCIRYFCHVFHIVVMNQSDAFSRPNMVSLTNPNNSPNLIQNRMYWNEISLTHSLKWRCVHVKIKITLRKNITCYRGGNPPNEDSMGRAAARSWLRSSERVTKKKTKDKRKEKHKTNEQTMKK